MAQIGNSDIVPRSSTTAAPPTNLPPLATLDHNGDEQKPRLNLVDMPLEIFQQVASHGTCKSVLALQCTCRALRRACSNVTVIMNIMKRNSNRNIEGAASPMPPWYNNVLTVQAPLSDWMRYGLADEEAAYMVRDSEDIVSHRIADEPDQKRYMSWLPQLIASHRVIRIDPSQVVDCWELKAIIGHIVHSGGLSPDEEQVMVFSSVACGGFQGREFVQSFGLANNAILMVGPERSSSQSLQMWHNMPDKFSVVQALLIVSGFKYLLVETPYRYNSALFLNRQLKYPFCDQIPFSSFMNLPKPFSRASVRSFASCHLPIMTTASFIVGDEWFGYHTSREYPYRGAADPPMHGIIFANTNSSSTSPTELLHFSARGIDGVNPFSLVGEIECSSGRVTFNKEYSDGILQCSSGVMTPFGMVGMWREDVDGGIWGWFWLWKRKWTRNPSTYIHHSLSTSLEEYRTRVLSTNRAILIHELKMAHIETSSTDQHDISFILAKLWGDSSQPQSHITKIADLFAPGILPDGTIPPLPRGEKAAVITQLELELNEAAPLFARPLRVPDDYKILFEMVGGIIGPGLPIQRQNTVVAIVNEMPTVHGREYLLRNSGLKEQDGWQVAVGWNCSSSAHQGAIYVVFCRYDGGRGKYTRRGIFYREWGWRYVFVPGIEADDAESEGASVYTDVMELLCGYMNCYIDVFETGSWRDIEILLS